MAEHSEDAKASPIEPEAQPRIAPRVILEAQKESAPTPANVDALMKLAAVARVLAAGVNRGSQPGPQAKADGAAKKGRRFQRVATAEKRSADPSPAHERALTQRAAAQSERDAGPSTAIRSMRRSYPKSARARAAVRASAKFAAWRRRPVFVWLVVQIFCFGLIAFGVLLGTLGSRPSQAVAADRARANEPTPAATAAAAPSRVARAGSEEALQTADLVVAKESAGDYPGAQILLESLAKSPAPPGSEYQLAWLALRRHDRANAGPHLERSLAANEAVAPCHYLRAAFAGAAGDYGKASAELRLAAQAEPFNGRYFFYWGECLRRNGQLPEAVARLEQALARPHNAGDGDLYRFKLRLTHLEAGRGDPFAADLEEHLRRPTPTGDWLLLAAAQNIRRNAFGAAAEFLRRAAGMLPPETFRAWVQDYAFQNYAREPQLAAALAPGLASPAESSPSAKTFPPDPTVCTPAEGDPALWQRSAPDS